MFVQFSVIFASRLTFLCSMEADSGVEVCETGVELEV